MQHIVEHLSRDERLAPVIAHVGPPTINYMEPTFYALARSIVYQQLSGKAAGTIFGRLEERAGGVTPENILRLRLPTLRKCGLSNAKAAYVRSLAEHTRDGRLVFDRLSAMADEEVIAALTDVKGVGEWTAQMFLMFALRREDVLPTADLGIRAAMKRLYRMRELPKPDRMHKIAKPWAPYRTFACWYLWRSLEITTPEAAK